MATIQPFRALRPRPDMAESVAAPPYDVVSKDEARRIAEGKPCSFLRVSRAELELDDSVDPYSGEVYERGARNLRRLVSDGVIRREAEPVLGVYRQQMGHHIQTGLVGLASVVEYDAGRVRKHELTRPAKENDRVQLIEAHNSQSGPVFLTYRQTERLTRWFDRVTRPEPEVDFVADDGIGHTVWVVREPGLIDAAVAAFAEVPRLYIADGHHRSAAASRVYASRAEQGRLVGGEDGFLTVTFPHDALQILPYNRVVRNLTGHPTDALIERLGQTFRVYPTDEPGKPGRGGFDMYLGGRWYRADVDPATLPNDPVGALAVSVLSERVLAPIFGIVDQRTDPRIDFIGGIRGRHELERRVDGGPWDLALWLYPTTVDELMAVADAEAIMPPKSTWFEPKLRDGLFIHGFGDDW